MWTALSARFCLLVAVALQKTLCQPKRACNASIPTITYVNSCPASEDDWHLAEKRKSCHSVKQNCVEASKFKYHCVVNEYGNMSLEVCAETWYISGFCTEFNTKGYIIQDHYAMDCTTFQKDPCPSRYLSSDSYKYSKCYENTLPYFLPHKANEAETQVADKTFIILDSVLGFFLCVLLLLCMALIFNQHREKWKCFYKDFHLKEKKRKLSIEGKPYDGGSLYESIHTGGYIDLEDQDVDEYERKKSNKASIEDYLDVEKETTEVKQITNENRKSSLTSPEPFKRKVTKEKNSYENKSFVKRAVDFFEKKRMHNTFSKKK